MNTDRLETFCDGVFAIAITLLIIEVRVPTGAEEHIWEALLGLWPSYLAYLISFLNIGIGWVNHHAMFQNFRRADRNLLFINLFLLLCVAFLPFPTALLAEYIRAGEAAHAAAAVYGANMTLVCLAFVCNWLYVISKPELLVDGAGPERVRRMLGRSAIGLTVFGAATAISFLSAYAAMATYAGVALYFVLPSRRYGRAPAGSSRKGADG